MSNSEDIKFQTQEPLVDEPAEQKAETDSTEEAKVEGPVVDPTGTFVDWGKLKESGYSDISVTVRDDEHIPLPQVDEEGYKVLKPNPHVTISRPMYSIKEPRKGLFPLFNFVGTEAEMFSAYVHYDIQNQRKNKKYVDDHSEILETCRAEMISDSYLWRTQWRPGSNWTNNPVLKDREMAMGPTSTGEVLNQVQLGNKSFSTGINNATVLWHSGFNVRIKAPTGRQLAELDALIASEKNVFGRRSGGGLFTSTRCYLESGVTDLFISCIDHSNVDGWTPDIIRSLIDNRDIQVMALAMQAAKYPSGYLAVEPCVESEANCRNVREVSFTPMNALIVDDAFFKPNEIEFLYNRSTKRSVQAILDFQKEASWNRKHTFRVNDALELRIHHAKAIDVQNAGFVWAGSITASLNRVLGDDSPTRNRQVFLSNLIDTESLRRFFPYIDGIIINDVEKELTEETLLEVLAHLNDDPELVRKIELEIRDFEERDIIAYMATPRNVCNECEKRLALKDPERLKEYQEHPIMVPQDAVARFFTARRL